MRVVDGGGQLRLFRAVLSVKAETLVGPQSVTAAERHRNPSRRVASLRHRSADFCSAKIKFRKTEKKNASFNVWTPKKRVILSDLILNDFLKLLLFYYEVGVGEGRDGRNVGE